MFPNHFVLEVFPTTKLSQILSFRFLLPFFSSQLQRLKILLSPQIRFFFLTFLLQKNKTCHLIFFVICCCGFEQLITLMYDSFCHLLRGQSLSPFCNIAQSDFFNFTCDSERTSLAICNLKKYEEDLPLEYQVCLRSSIKPCSLLRFLWYSFVL